jgi:hypothetical protein
MQCASWLLLQKSKVPTVGQPQHIMKAGRTVSGMGSFDQLDREKAERLNG